MRNPAGQNNASLHSHPSHQRTMKGKERQDSSTTATNTTMDENENEKEVLEIGIIGMGGLG